MAFPNVLEGRTILITRPSSQTSDTIEAVRKQGGRPLVFPVLSIIDPESWEGCDAALRRLETYDGLVFTSVNGVAGLFRRAELLGVDTSALRDRPIYAVGQTTADRIVRAGFRVTSIPQTYSAEDLARTLTVENVRDRRFLLSQGSISQRDVQDALTAAGAVVESIIVYRTVEVVPPETDALVSLLENGAVDVVTFASPSAVKGFFHATRSEPLFKGYGVPVIAVIGPTTSEEVRRRGLPVSVVAATSTMDGLMEAIRDYFTDLRQS